MNETRSATFENLGMTIKNDAKKYCTYNTSFGSFENNEFYMLNIECYNNERINGGSIPEVLPECTRNLIYDCMKKHLSAMELELENILKLKKR